MATTNDTPKRRCRTCGIEYPETIDHFYRSGKYLLRQCRNCLNKYFREYHAKRMKHDTKYQQKRREYDHQIKQDIRKRGRRRRLENERNRERWETDIEYREAKKARNRRYYNANADEINEKNREAYYRNMKIPKYRQAKRNRDQRRYHSDLVSSRKKAREAAQKRFERVRNAPGEYTQEDIESMYLQQNGLCGYCGIRLFWDIPGDIHLDHVIPVSKSGSNYPDNLILSCSGCNKSKKDKLVEEWVAARRW